MLYVHHCTLYNDEAHYKRYTRNNVATTPCYYLYPKINSRGKVTYKKHHEQKKIQHDKLEEIYALYITGKGLLSLIHEELVKIKGKKTPLKPHRKKGQMT